MRRRRSADVPATAVEVVALWTRADADAATDDVQARMAYVRDVLSLHGTDPVEALRARRWLRKGLSGEGWRG